MEETLKLVSAGDCIQIWNLLLFYPEARFNPHTSEQEVSSLCWSPNNQFLLSAASGGDRISVSICKTKPVHLWSIAEQRGQICVSLNSTRNMVLSGGTDCTVNMWDLKTRNLHKSYKGHKGIVTCLTNDWDDHCVLSGSLSGEIILHDMLNDEVPPTYCCRNHQPLRDLKISCFQRSLLGSVGDDGTLALWDLNTLQLQHSFDYVHKAPAKALCFSPVIEPLIVTVGLDKHISAFDVRSKSILYNIRADSPLTAIELLPDGTTLVIGCSQGKVSLYDLRNMEFPVKSSKAHSSAVRCIKLQTVRGKFQVAWPTAWSNVKGGGFNISTIDTSNEDVSTFPSDSSTLQVSTITPNKPPQFRKVIFLARNSFGDIFSPIRSDITATELSLTPPNSCTSNCFPLTQSVGNLSKISELFSEDACDQVQNLHNCNSKQEMIEQKPYPKTLANTLSNPSIQPGKEGTRQAVSVAKTQLLQNMVKDALEEFSDAHHKEVVGLQLAMIHEFHIQQIAIREAVLKHLVGEELLKEFVTLKEENKRLKEFH
ncbi:protein NEDD1-like isoform X2 [Scyliorhinus canicula]|nr:protein NEDD1-like isoform X2 [Scyliorhinus canicula]